MSTSVKTRTEYDSIGCLQVPAEAYYGVQSLRAARNFNMTQHKVHKEMIISLAQVKKAAAAANYSAGSLPYLIYKAIDKACDCVIAGELDREFITDAIQGGAGTSANMNANEVIANKALEILGHKQGEYQFLHPNDHVNMSQSTNDVYPTAGRITAFRLIERAAEQLERLEDAMAEKAEEFSDVLKMGRTQLQDAVPMTLGQNFGAYRSAVARGISRLKRAQKLLLTVNMGGTAIGTGINVSPAYYHSIAACVSRVTGLKICQADDLIDATQNLDDYVEVSGALKACAVSLSKIANDLRLLSSGPRAGMHEINLPAMQNGSSIMPGKVNPVIPEVVSQVAFAIIGNDTTITLAAEAGQLELNAFEPVLFYRLFESADTLAAATATFVDNCITGITANRTVCGDYLNRSAGIATALCPVIGYARSAKLAKDSLKTDVPVKVLALKENLISERQADELLCPTLLTSPHALPLYEEVKESV